jgi:uncharacterized SAM-binding protein YcdF (DUF218 family)
VTYSEPLLPVFLLLGFIGSLKQWRAANGRKPVLVLAAFAGIFLSCWPPSEWLFSRPLESWYMDAVLPPLQRPEAIVILSSHVEPISKYSPVPLPDSSTLGGCKYGALLYHHWHGLPVIVSGGSTAALHTPVAAEMADLLIKEGVLQDHIHQEAQSRNTHENAAYTAELLRTLRIKRVALVVQADSMLRAEWCFHREGIDIVPAPFLHRELDVTPYSLIPSWGALRGNERTLHELGGLAWYKLRGWI